MQICKKQSINKWYISDNKLIVCLAREEINRGPTTQKIRNEVSAGKRHAS